MHQFRDNKDRTWELSITVGSVRRVRDVLKVDLAGLFEDKMEPLAALLADVCKFVDVLWVLVEKQADAKKVTDIEFGESLGGDALEAATNAFMDELTFFFPTRRKEKIQKVLAEVRKVTEKVQERAMGQLEALDLDAAADEVWRRLSNGSLTAAPASSDSTPTPSP